MTYDHNKGKQLHFNKHYHYKSGVTGRGHWVKKEDAIRSKGCGRLLCPIHHCSIATRARNGLYRLRSYPVCSVSGTVRR